MLAQISMSSFYTNVKYLLIFLAVTIPYHAPPALLSRHHHHHHHQLCHCPISPPLTPFCHFLVHCSAVTMAGGCRHCCLRRLCVSQILSYIQHLPTYLDNCILIFLFFFLIKLFIYFGEKNIFLPVSFLVNYLVFKKMIGILNQFFCFF